MFNLLFYLGFAYLSLTIFMGIKLWYGLFIAALFGLIIFLYRQVPASIANKWLALFTSSEDTATTNFVLSAKGECQFNQQETWKICANSQINLWGYWLVFSKEDTAVAKQFIFKDSLSSEDQARIARTIMRVKTSPELNH
ncbi:MAG: hypothetical protein ACI89T_000020 [Cognaticolwellia sp.]|jgi:hypothetical protein